VLRFGDFNHDVSQVGRSFCSTVMIRYVQTGSNAAMLHEDRSILIVKSDEEAEVREKNTRAQ